MLKKDLPGVLIFLMCVCSINNAAAQALQAEEYYRRNQLLGNIDSNISFTVRPVSLRSVETGNPHHPDSSFRNLYYLRKAGAAEKTINLQLLPITWENQYNSHHPYGWNDGSLIRAKGYQTRVSAGFSAKAMFLNVQLKPELVYAENRPFNEFPTYYSSTDLPERYGKGAYSQLSWGQSSVRLNFGPLSAGISNENLWWGPGVRNSLLMSYSAAGFKHLTLNTSRPILTPIGSMEGQIIAGRLEGSGFTPPKSEEWRYLSAMVLTYQPKWVPGLFLGFSRSFQTYNTELKSFSDYLPLFRPFQKINDKNNTTGFDAKDQLASFHARWLFRESKSELYLEYGVNDHSLNQRDFLMSPEHSRAYMAGMKKILPFKGRHDEYLEVSLELTHLQQSIDKSVREAGAWYRHDLITHGYTHQGEVLGAGIGPGGNLQTFDVSWNKGLKHLGLQFERFVHNNEFFYESLNDGDHRRWTDRSISAKGIWDYQNLILSAEVRGIHSNNYQWQLKQRSADVFYPSGNNVFNLHARIGISYRFQ